MGNGMSSFCFSWLMWMISARSALDETLSSSQHAGTLWVWEPGHGFEKNVATGGGFKHFLFSPLLGEAFHFDYYFSNGLKPPMWDSKWIFVDVTFGKSIMTTQWLQWTLMCCKTNPSGSECNITKKGGTHIHTRTQILKDIRFFW